MSTKIASSNGVACCHGVPRLSGPKHSQVRKDSDMNPSATEAQLNRVLSRYRLGRLRAAWRPAHGFVNDNWIVQTSAGRCFVKHRHPSLAEPAFIAAQHALTRWLRRHGFPAPALLPTVDGETLLILGRECYEVQEYIEGSDYDHGRAAHLEEAAATLGRHHALVRGFAPAVLCRPAELYHPRLLRTNLTRLAETWQLDDDTGLARLRSKLGAEASDLAKRFATHGNLRELLIHGDYYADHLLFDDDRIVGVVDYDKACWQPRVVELAEALIYFASPRPGDLRHLVYPGVLQWKPFTEFLQAYARVTVPDESEVQVLPDYIRCVWLQASVQRLSQEGRRPTPESEALEEMLRLAGWARANAATMIEICHSAIG